MTAQLENRAQEIAEAILNAAGSGLRHYTPQSKERILTAAKQEIVRLSSENVGAAK